MKALHLDQRLTTALLDRSLGHAPAYERFAPAARHAIRVLHGLPGLFDDRPRSGRAEPTARASTTP